MHEVAVLMPDQAYIVAGHRCAGEALQASTNTVVLLLLGVSHTHGLDQAQALTYLHTWMDQGGARCA